ncbi:MAG: Thioredoxin [Candidatus Methanohalarchaeum thermophilum]|uniref:Thioredoxin n=1 Tax=Methanohalarchaeum thermophilum TaxID=1903181 RepID=A0A1Q6DSA5_METT1|nr:MAG: Thioredoxin [Candidatus Methanohalarchaeum thermophilum]
MKIKVYGSSGCEKCSSLKEKIEEVIDELDNEKQLKVEKIEDMAEMASKGIMSTPAVSISGEVKFRGRLPSKEEIREELI